MIPKEGDKFFTGFESEFDSFGEILIIAKIEGEIIDEKGNEGRSIIASDGIGYDCFWSKTVQYFVYGLDQSQSCPSQASNLEGKMKVEEKLQKWIDEQFEENPEDIDWNGLQALFDDVKSHIRQLEEGVRELIAYGVPKHVEEGLYELLEEK